MEEFKTKYPAFVVLFTLIAMEAKIFADQSSSVVQKLSNEITALPKFLEFIPMASKIDDEYAVLKNSLSDIEIGIEYFVTELAFSSEKAKEVIDSSFEVAEKLVQLVPSIKNLIGKIKA